MKKQASQVQEVIYGQLKKSKIHDVPFFECTGIHDVVLIGEDILSLVNIPENPNHINSINIFYARDANTYRLSFFQRDLTVANEIHENVSWNELVNRIAKTLGVY